MPFSTLSFPISTGDQLAEVFWSTIGHVETQDETFFSKAGLAAKDRGREDAHKRRPGVPIILKDELRKGPGEEVRIRMRLQLTRTARNNSSVYGDGSLLGSEEALVFYDVSAWLALLKNAVGYNSPDLYYHRTSIDMEQDAEDALREWLVENHEEAILDTVYDGHPYFVIQSVSSASTTNHPRQYNANGKASYTDLDSADVMNAAEVRRMRSYFRNRKLNPIKIEGKSCGVVLADTFVCNDLRADEAFTKLADAADRGSDNPIVSGAIYHYQQLYFHEYERMRQRTGDDANVGRAALLGADAICVVYGSEPRLVPRVETAYGDRWGRAIRQVFSARRAEFQDQDNTAANIINQSSAEWNVWEEQDEFAA